MYMLFHEPKRRKNLIYHNIIHIPFPAKLIIPVTVATTALTSLVDLCTYDTLHSSFNTLSLYLV